MQSLFETYFELGFQHILDLNGYDHALFLIALCAIYQLKEWKKVAILATAFTIGHSLTLGMAAFDVIKFQQDIVEILIPVTILFTAFYNVVDFTPPPPKGGEGTLSAFEGDFSRFRRLGGRIHYLFALLFGFIHGMGFSNFFKSTTMPGRESELFEKLLSFNIGVEIGQILIVFILLIISYLGMNVLKIKQREWTLFVSGAAAGVAIILIIEKIG